MQKLTDDTAALAAVEALGFTVAAGDEASNIAGAVNATGHRLAALTTVLDAHGYTSREMWSKGMAVFHRIEPGERL